MAMSVVYGNAFGRVVCETRGGVHKDYVRDTLGSTQALVDSTGAVTDTFDFWPNGETLSRTGTTPTPFTFLGVLGYFQDVLSKLSYVRRRFLRPDLARWLTVDPVWPGTRPYVYVNLRPSYLRDPSGLLDLISMPPGAFNCADPAWKNYISAYCQACRQGRLGFECKQNCDTMVQRYLCECENVGCAPPPPPPRPWIPVFPGASSCDAMLQGWDGPGGPGSGEASDNWKADCLNCCLQIFGRQPVVVCPLVRDLATDCANRCMEGTFLGLGAGVEPDTVLNAVKEYTK